MTNSGRANTRSTHFNVIVNLTSDVYFNVSSVLKWNSDSALTSPWPKDWIITSVREIETATYMNKTHLRVDLKRTVRNTGFSRILKIIKHFVNKEWTLKNGKTYYILKSKLPVWDYVLTPDQSDIVVDHILFGNHTRHLSLPKISTLFFANYLGPVVRSTKQVTISRLYYCNLVELTPSEFVLSKYRTAIFNVRTQRLMSVIHSFVITERSDGTNFSVKICFEDSGLFEENKSPGFNKHETLFVILAIVNKWLFFVMY